MATQKWYKGNIHTHTTESDGDESPEKVVGWYRRLGELRDELRGP